jgi:UDP-N-acetylmuramoylalanine--D-glutamate ligase
MLFSGKFRVFRGAVTNISENHLDWHKSFEEYKNSKLALFSRSEEAVLNLDDPISAASLKSISPWAITSKRLGYKELRSTFSAHTYYTLEDGYIRRNGENILEVSRIKRREEHNLSNVLTALALTDGYVKRERIKEVLESFSGLEHRSELFFTKNGMSFINSSIDSSPKRTETTLNSLAREVIIILGGRGKNLSYKPLCEPLSKWAKLVLICGENSEEIYKEVGSFCRARLVPDLESGVRIAREVMKSGDTLLLSPASTSFDKYANFEQRGQIFKETVYKIFGDK